MIKDLYNNFNDSYDKLINVLDDIIAKKIEYNIDDLSSYIHKFDDVTIINKIGLAICSYGKNAEHIILKLLDSKSESVVLSMLSGIKHYHDIIPATIFEKISILCIRPVNCILVRSVRLKDFHNGDPYVSKNQH